MKPRGINAVHWFYSQSFHDETVAWTFGLKTKDYAPTVET